MRTAIGYALVCSLGIGTALVTVALVMPAPPAGAGGDVQHALLVTGAGSAVPVAASCPYVAQRGAANACPYRAGRAAAGGCPYLAGRTGSDCPALGGGSGSVCPRAGRPSEPPPPADRSDRGVLLAALGQVPAPAAS